MLERSGYQQDAIMDDYMMSMWQYYALIRGEKYAREVRWYEQDFDPQKRKVLEEYIVGPLLDIPSRNLRTIVRGVMRCVPRIEKDGLEYFTMKIHRVDHIDADIVVQTFPGGYVPSWQERWSIATDWGLKLILEPESVRKTAYPNANGIS